MPSRPSAAVPARVQDSNITSGISAAAAAFKFQSMQCEPDQATCFRVKQVRIASVPPVTRTQSSLLLQAPQRHGSGRARADWPQHMAVRVGLIGAVTPPEPESTVSKEQVLATGSLFE